MKLAGQSNGHYLELYSIVLYLQSEFRDVAPRPSAALRISGQAPSGTQTALLGVERYSWSFIKIYSN